MSGVMSGVGPPFLKCAFLVLFFFVEARKGVCVSFGLIFPHPD